MDNGLPTGWVSDYDGSRWLYRYMPTGLAQFAYPRPGDEFPQFDAPGAGPIAFTPEERLAYEKHLKLRKEGEARRASPIASTGETGAKDYSFITKSTSGYFDPSGFMYLGDCRDDELTPVDKKPTDPLGFLAELPTGDTVLCADEMAPVELDASPIESVVNAGLAGDVDNSSIILRPSPTEPVPNHHVPVSNPPDTNVVPSDQDDIYSSGTFTKTQPDPQSPTVQDPPRPGVASSTRLITTPQAEPRSGPRTPRFTFDPISPPTMSGNPNLATPPMLDRKVNPSTPRVMNGTSLDDMLAMPSSLQPHEPAKSRSRSKSSSHEPWTPTITFVQTGSVHESKVLTPATSPARILEQQVKQSEPQVNRVSEWLDRQSFGGPLLDPRNNAMPNPASLEIPPAEVTTPVRHRELEPASVSTSSPRPNPAQLEKSPITHIGQASPLTASRDSPNKLVNGPQDRVVERVIEVPDSQTMGMSRGVQLMDVSPGRIARRGAMKVGQDQRQIRRSFSWENDSDVSSDEVKEKPLARAQAVPQQSPSKPLASPRKSPVPSPRHLLGGSLVPSPGRTTAFHAVLVEHTPLQPSSATVETFSKPLPPLPLAPRQWPSPDLVLNQPKLNAFEQISEMIAVANAAMPSARRGTAVEVDIPSEDDWTVRGMATSRSDPGSPDQLTPRPFAPWTTAQTDARMLGRRRSASQQPLFIGGLKPPARKHTRSRSLVSPITSSPAPSLLSPGRSPATRSGASTPVPVKRGTAAESGDYKSHDRDTIYKTSTGDFSYHPLRSAPLSPPPSEILPGPERNQLVNHAVQSTAPPLHLDLDSPPKSPPMQRPLLQLKVPSYPGLPSSPRPSPNFPPKVRAKASGGKPEEEPVMDEVCTIEQTTNLVKDRRMSLTDSAVSSPTSSIFSSLRDSQVSATSSMADSSMMDLTAELVALEKHQAQRIQYRRARSHTHTGGQQMPSEAAHMLAFTSPSASSPVPAAAKPLDGPVGARAFSPRPEYMSAAIRPAGTSAGPQSPPEVREPVTARQPIPTLVLRAPTVRLRPEQAYYRRKSSSFEYPPSPISVVHSPVQVPDVEVVRRTVVVNDIEFEAVVAVSPPPAVVMEPLINFVKSPFLADTLPVNTAETAPTNEPLLETPAVVNTLEDDMVEQQPPHASAPLPAEPLIKFVKSTFLSETFAADDAEDTPEPLLETADVIIMEEQQPPRARAAIVEPLINYAKSPSLVNTFNDTDNNNNIPTPPEPVHEPPAPTTPVAQDSPLATKAEGFLSSLVSSWESSTFAAPRAGPAAPPSRPYIMRAQSANAITEPQSPLPEPQPQGSKFAQALAMAKKQAPAALLAWQSAKKEQDGDNNRDHWPERDSLPVNSDSISNVGAAIRFFNASFQALRPARSQQTSPAPSQPASPMPLQRSASSPVVPGGGSSQPPSPATPFSGTDVMMAATVVKRRRGPPVVVRMSVSPERAAGGPTSAPYSPRLGLGVAPYSPRMGPGSAPYSPRMGSAPYSPRMAPTSAPYSPRLGSAPYSPRWFPSSKSRTSSPAGATNVN